MPNWIAVILGASVIIGPLGFGIFVVLKIMTGILEVKDSLSRPTEGKDTEWKI